MPPSLLPYARVGAHPRSLIDRLLRELPLPDPRLLAVIIVPVCNEAERVEAMLQGLADQRDERGQLLACGSFEALILANNCADDTAEIARNFASRQPQLRLHSLVARFYKNRANVGHARRVLMDLACRRLCVSNRPLAFIASTDGDTRAAPGWLSALQVEIAQGADAVGGRIVNSDASMMPANLVRMQRQNTQYHLLRARAESLLDPDPYDPWPRHHQHFGANFAVRVSAYRAVGGLPRVAHLEDEALFRELLAHDLRVRHSSGPRVYTSTRQNGRAELGLSAQLREWQEMLNAGRQPQLESAISFRETLDLKRRLRTFWDHRGDDRRDLGSARALAARFGLKAEALGHTINQSPYFGHFWQQLEPRWRESVPRRYLPQMHAIESFRKLVAVLESTNGSDSNSSRSIAYDGLVTGASDQVFVSRSRPAVVADSCANASFERIADSEQRGGE